MNLEAPAEARTFGSGWISGVGALIASLAGFLLMLSVELPTLFATKELSALYQWPYFLSLVQGLLILGFALACANLILRRNKILGFSAIIVVFVAITLGQVSHLSLPQSSAVPIGLDWFVLNMLLTGILFVPLEKLFGRLTDQPLFRSEWREDLFYFLLSSVLVQTLTYLSLAPSMAILQHTSSWSAF